MFKVPSSRMVQSELLLSAIQDYEGVKHTQSCSRQALYYQGANMLMEMSYLALQSQPSSVALSSEPLMVGASTVWFQAGRLLI